MSFNLEQLPHQQAAIEAVVAAMKGCRDFNETQDPDYRYVYANPLIKLKYDALQTTKLPESLGGKGIDVKMETGTGKTYVYTRLMYELNKQFGLNKFVLFVPSLAIKEGTKNFITADYARQHFAMHDMYDGMRIDLNPINAGDFTTKKGRLTMASDLVDYLEGSRNEAGTIKCLLMNDAMLTSKSMTRDDYDQTLIGSTSSPIEGVKNTRPIVIIDEPHRFKKDGKAWQTIQSLDPQLIIRFGATFPDITISKGRSKIVKKDYENLVYNLGSVQAFNDGLVKGVNVYYPEIGEEVAKDITQYKVTEIVSRGKDKCVRLKRVGTDKSYDIKINETLSVVDGAFEGDVELAEIKSADFAVLSNDQTLSRGMILTPQVYSSSYQELVVVQAIDKHFARERENWFRDDMDEGALRVKTLSLFFIDSIASYREADGWLKQVFERLLSSKLRALIETEQDENYKAFLEASLADIDALHAGYFAEDHGSGDVALQQEVDDILRGKERLTKFVGEDGTWNTRRFLFSKWTLREGWDNPNVFVITKLRTSGSEISKLQEVGRGLRLPVDESGKRLSNEQFMLDYIIDWSERDFAERLVSEINNDGGKLTTATPELYAMLVEAGYAQTTTKAKAKLLIDEIIDENDAVIDQDALLALLPSDKVSVLKQGRVTSNDRGRAPKVKLRHENWQKLSDIWGDITRRYMLELEPISDDDLRELVEKAVETCNMSEASIGIRKETLVSSDDMMQVSDNIEYVATSIGTLTYGDFLKQLAKHTSVSIALWHNAMVRALPRDVRKEVFNQQNIAQIIGGFASEFERAFAGKYQYSSLDYTAKTSVMKQGNFVDELEQGLVGTNLANDVIIEDCYLYDSATYDSSIEHEVLKVRPPENVLVYGKLPRSSIRVPTYTGGTTTPDFIYAIDKGLGKMEVNLLVETKARDIRMGEQAAVESQEKLFENIKNVNWRKVVRVDELDSILRGL